jgi:hypothetical protein
MSLDSKANYIIFGCRGDIGQKCEMRWNQRSGWKPPGRHCEESGETGETVGPGPRLRGDTAGKAVGVDISVDHMTDINKARFD